ELAEAEKLYEESLAAKPRAEVAERLVELYRQQGNVEKILKTAGPFVARDHSLQAIREPAQKIAADQGLVSKIIAAARRVAKEPADKRPPDALLAAALLALDGKQFDAAEELFTAEVAGSAEKRGEVLLAWGLGQ